MKPEGSSTPATISNNLPWIVAIGAITFTVGVSGALLFSQSQASKQSETLAALASQIVQMQNQPDVTRAETPDILAITQPADEPASAPVFETTESGEYVEVVAPTPLADFKPIDLSASARTRAAQHVADPDFDPMNASREETISVAIASVSEVALNVVDGNYDVVTDVRDGKNVMRLDLPESAATSATLEVLLARAAANGDIALKESVAGSDGTVDPQTLLFDLVQRSLENGSAEEVEAARELSRRAFAASSAETETIAGERFYTVEPGDSLAYIALQFYGSTSAYGRIYDANRDTLASPEKVLVGQRLRIPNA